MPIYNNSHIRSLDESSAEAELRSLIDNIVATLPQLPPGDLVAEILSYPKSLPECIKVLDRWMDKLRPSLALPAKTRIKQLVVKLLSRLHSHSHSHRPKANSLHRNGGDVGEPVERKDHGVVLNGESVEKKYGSLFYLVKALKVRAAGDCQEKFGEWREEALLRAREALFVPVVEIQDNHEYPSKKRQKTQKPVRRSTRTVCLFELGGGNTLRKRIGIGENFQADIPYWTGKPDKETDELRFLGTRCWPRNRKGCPEMGQNMVGKGRPQTCICNSKGSVDCIKLHITTIRPQLQSELAQAFHIMEFDKMGEQISERWTGEEQKTFHDFVRNNPPSVGMSFCKPALEHFRSKSSREIASYYFNVYVLRRMRYQTRSATRIVDSDDDETDYDRSLQASYSGSAQRCKRMQYRA